MTPTTFLNIHVSLSYHKTKSSPACVQRRRPQCAAAAVLCCHRVPQSRPAATASTITTITNNSTKGAIIITPEPPECCSQVQAALVLCPAAALMLDHSTHRGGPAAARPTQRREPCSRCDACDDVGDGRAHAADWCSIDSIHTLLLAVPAAGRAAGE